MADSSATSTANALRLVSVTEPGSTLYNSYHYLTQVSGLYAQAAKYDPTKATATVWGELADLAIRDLGDVFVAWDTVVKESRAGRTLVSTPGIGATVVRACRRTEVLVSLMNNWTPMSKWANVLQLCEHRWQRFVDIFGASSPLIFERLAEPRYGSRERLMRLGVLKDTYQVRAAHMQNAIKFKGAA